MHGENDRLFQSMVLSRQVSEQEPAIVVDAANLVRIRTEAMIHGKHLLGLLVMESDQAFPTSMAKEKVREFIDTFRSLPRCRSTQGNVQVHDWRNGLACLAAYETESMEYCRTTLKSFLRQLECFSPTEFISNDEVQLVDLVYLINKQVRAIRNRFPSRAIALSLTLDTEPVFARPWPIIMSLHNLLFNADQASEPAERITIILSTRAFDQHELSTIWNGQKMQPGNYAALSVSDKGHGMPEEVRDRLFNEAVTTKIGGTGTGLKYLGETVAKMNGGASVESCPQGTTITMYIPFAKPRQ